MKSTFIFLFLITGFIHSYGQVKTDSVRTEKPEFLWGHYKPGPLRADSFRAQKKLTMPAGYKLIKATIYFTGANFKNIEKFDLFENDVEVLLSPITKCVPGTMVVFEKVLVTDGHGDQIFLHNCGFILY